MSIWESTRSRTLTEPVRVYRIQMEPGAVKAKITESAVKTKVAETRPGRSPWYWTSLGAAAVVTLIIARPSFWKFYPRQSAGPSLKVPAGQERPSEDASSEGSAASLPGRTRDSGI